VRRRRVQHLAALLNAAAKSESVRVGRVLVVAQGKREFVDTVAWLHSRLYVWRAGTSKQLQACRQAIAREKQSGPLLRC
jgi:hypothetical protein